MLHWCLIVTFFRSCVKDVEKGMIFVLSIFVWLQLSQYETVAMVWLPGSTGIGAGLAWMLGFITFPFDGVGCCGW